jgi:hypothetical protein
VRNQGQPAQTRSLRGRLGEWSAVTLVTAIATLTATALFEERRMVLSVQSAMGLSLVHHLSGMPELRSGRLHASSQVRHLETLLAPAGISLELVEAGTPSREGTLATAPLPLPEGTFELRYRTDAPWLEALVRRAVLFHVAVGVATLALLLGGTHVIIRSRLSEPLRRISHQIRFMRSGGGWSPKLPASDEELRDLEAALLELGPGLQVQVQQWVEAERRAAAVGAISRLRSRLRDPRRRAQASLGDLLARGLVAPDGRGRVRDISRDLDSLSREIEAEESATCGANGQSEVLRSWGQKDGA